MRERERLREEEKERERESESERARERKRETETPTRSGYECRSDVVVLAHLPDLLTNVCYIQDEGYQMLLYSVVVILIVMLSAGSWARG